MSQYQREGWKTKACGISTLSYNRYAPKVKRVELLGNLFLLFTPGSSVWVNTVHFNDRGALGQVGRHNHLARYVNDIFMEGMLTYRNRHQLLDILDLVSGRARPQTFEHGLDLDSRKKALPGCFPLLNNLLVSAKHYLVFFGIIFIEKSVLVVQGT